MLLLLVRYVSLNSLPEPFMMAILLFMPIVSRWAMVYAIFVYPYARPSGLGTAFKEATRWHQFTAATVTTLVVALALFPLFSFLGLMVIFGVWIITSLFSLYLKRKFSGLTGDTYGAINEVGLGLVPADRVSQLYRDLLGSANQRLAQHADEVILMVAGMSVKVKP